MFKKIAFTSTALAAIAAGMHWNSKAESQTPTATPLATHKPTPQMATFNPKSIEKLGFKVVSWQDSKQELAIELRTNAANSELYLQRLHLTPAECADEVDLGDSRIETINATTHVYHQQDPQSKVSPSISVSRGTVCWLIEGSSGLAHKQDLQTKLRLAQQLPLQ